MFTININQIAKLSGVSKATVSRVINRSGYVKEETRKKVEAVIKEYEYSPNPSSINFKKNGDVIGVILPEINNNFFSQVMEGISFEAQKLGFSVIYCYTSNDMDLEEQAVKMMKKHKVSGLIITPATGFLTPSAQTILTKMYESLNIPIVLLDREFENSKWDGVFYENFQSGYTATSKLIEIGHREIAIITGDLKLKLARQRFEGFISALEENKIELKDENILKGDFTLKKAYELSCKALDSSFSATAYLCCNNLTSLGFIKACNERKLTIGEDISLIGIDHIQSLESIGYPFSCVTRDSFKMGSTAVEMISEKLGSESKTKKIALMGCELRLSGSEHHKLFKGESI